MATARRGDRPQPPCATSCWCRRDGVEHPENDRRQRICHAKSRRNPTGHCHSTALHPNGRCRMHAGQAATGVLASRFEHGRYSRYLPARLLDGFAAAKADPAALELRDDIALLDVRIGEVVQALPEGASSTAWQTARAQFEAMTRAIKGGDNAGAQVAAAALGELLERGVDEAKTWTEITTLLERRRRLVESERERIVQAHEVITRERALVLITAVAEAVNRHVTDPAVRIALSGELLRLTSAAPGPAAAG